jgi:vitamin B12 transporter
MLSATRFETDGFSSINTKQYPGENPDKDGDLNRSVAGSVSHEWSRGNEIGARFYGDNAKFSYDNGGSGPSTRIDKGRSEQNTYAIFSKNRLTSNWLSTLTASETETLRKDTGTNGGVVLSDSRYKGSTSMLQWTNELMLTSNWVTTAGFDLAKERADVYASGWSLTQFDTSRSNSSAYAGLNGKLYAHSVQFNVRNDHVGNSGSDTTGYLGYSYAFTPIWKVIASTSTAFLAPTLYQLDDPAYGNPDLKAERSRSKEIGLQYVAATTLVRGVFFESHTQDMIGYDPITWRPINIDKASNRGFEMSASSRIANVDVRSSLTL